MPHEALKEAPFSEGADINSVGNTQVMHTQPTNPVFPVPEDSRGLDTSVSNAEVRTTAAEGSSSKRVWRLISESLPNRVFSQNYALMKQQWNLPSNLRYGDEMHPMAANGGVSFPGCKGRCVMSTLLLFDPLRPTFYASLYVHKAARLRDSLKSFKEEEPVLCLRGLMNEAVVNDKFEVGLDLCYLDEAPLEEIIHIEVISKRILALKTKSLLSGGCISSRWPFVSRFKNTNKRLNLFLLAPFTSLLDANWLF
ncbi:hypothetical protein Tco_1106211 [Tanacetum coccineum]